MSARENTMHALPDVAGEHDPDLDVALDRVGMEAIEMPILLADADGHVQRVSARVDVAVNLDRPGARGIHMSRLYLHLDRHLSAEALTAASLRRLLRDLLESHADLSDRASVRIRFDHLVRRSALASGHSGWRAYPVEIGAATAGDGIAIELAVAVEYSSTCPASAALARQLIQDRFGESFSDAKVDRAAVIAWLGGESGIVATPHSQRSTADVKVRLAAEAGLPILDLVDAIEGALKTPVQTAVKREDEQAFALANGQNLMFCEDAARRIRRVLDADARYVDFRVRAAHHESLHPHDAVAVVTKGVGGGYEAA